MDLENVDLNKSINQHSVGAPGLEDGVSWLENVWTEYVRLKYNLILKKWYKTGGGARTLENFSNYCKLKDGNTPGCYGFTILTLNRTSFLIVIPREVHHGKQIQRQDLKWW